jgi:sterol desaturase/sphingolipid hydroxylase (fatty acid hydroxylase superfamily)
MGLAIFLILNFIIFSLGGYWFFYKVLGKGIEHRRIQEQAIGDKQIRREVLNSISTQFIFLVIGVFIFCLFKLGLTKIYLPWDERGSVYFFLSFFIIHQLHDAYFYWTHRWMHEKKFLKKFHLAHHLSKVPTPFSALSFHPVEAFIQVLFWILISLFIPLPALWLFGFYSFMYYINMWGHTNFEFWHKDLLSHPILRHLNTPTHHNLHHKYHHLNYGIYYNFWDRWCGTNHPIYEDHYRNIKHKTELSKTSKIMKLMKL